MAATVQGAFVLLDRASPKLRAMRREAEKTDAAMVALGHSIDGVGTNSQVRDMTRGERSVRNLGRAAGTSERDVRGMGNEMEHASRKTRDLSTRLGRLGAAMKGITVLAMPAKFLAIGSAIGVALQAVRALSAGVVALTPRIADLVGVVGALPATLTGVGLAVASVKLAFKDLGKAMGGNKKALQGLTPEARQFVAQLKQMQPLIKGLQQSSQRGLFPGLSRALQSSRKGLPLANSLLNRAGGAVGGQVSGLASDLTSVKRLRDINTLGTQGIGIVTKFGQGFRNLLSAVIDMGVAAKPFTDWLSNTILGWTKYAKASSSASRANGRWTAFFERTKQSLQTFGRITKNLFEVFRNIGHASRALGNDLYGSFDKTTKRWADWTGSMKGQNELRKWFDDAREPLHVIFGLLGDIGKAMATFDLHGLSATGTALRGAIPSVQKLFETLAGFGPDIAAAVSAFADLLANLGGATGPVTLILRSFTGILTAVNSLIKRIPALSTVLSALITGAAVAKLGGILGFGGFLGRGAASRGVGAGTAALGGAAAGGAARGAAGLRGNFKYLRAGGMGIRASGSMALAEAGGLAGLAGGAAGMAGPLLLLSGALGAAQGTGGAGASGLAQNALSGMTLGIAPSEQAKMQKAAAAGQADIARMRLSAGTSVAGTQGDVAALLRRRSQLQGTLAGPRKSSVIGGGSLLGMLGVGQGGTSAEDRKKAQTSLDLVNQEIKARQALIPQLRAEHAARSRNRGAVAGADTSSAFAIRLQSGKGHAVGNLHKDVMGAVQGRDFAGGRQVAQAGLDALREAAKTNPKLKKSYERLKDDVNEQFSKIGHNVVITGGQIKSATSKDWQRIRSNMTNPVERAKEDVSKAFTDIQNAAVGALMQMGYSKNAAKGIISGGDGKGGDALPSGGKASKKPNTLNPFGPKPGGLLDTLTNPKRARGGRLPGQGLYDTVMMADGGYGAPGELVVNRHTENAVDSLLSMFGTRLGALVAGEQRPHYAPMRATGGRVQTPKSGAGGAPGAIANSAMAGMARGANNILDSLNTNATGLGGGASDNTVPGGKVGGTLDKWLTTALNLTGHYSPSNLAGLRSRAVQESGGSPHAINLWDSNAKAGHPSKGLLQTIDSTFSAYALPGHGDIWNPVDNAAAAIGYMYSRYGHIVAANGQGYAKGGRLGPGAFGGMRARGGRMGGVSIGHVTIQNHRPGDIREQMQRELAAAFSDFVGGMTGTEDDGDLL